jgi:hypothetical protein
MAHEKHQSNPASVDPDLRMETELEPDPMLKLSEGKASPFQIWIIGLVVIVNIGVMVWTIS